MSDEGVADARIFCGIANLSGMTTSPEVTQDDSSVSSARARVGFGSRVTTIDSNAWSSCSHSSAVCATADSAGGDVVVSL
jgi:hypothetical protein